MEKAAESEVKDAIRRKVPYLDLELMERERKRFWRAEREKRAIRKRLERLIKEKGG